MKKIFVILLSVVSIFLCSCVNSRSLDELLSEVFKFVICNEDDRTVMATIFYRDGEWESFETLGYSKILSVDVKDDIVLFKVEYSTHCQKGEFTYSDWYYPSNFNFSLEAKTIEKIIETNKSKYKFYSIFINPKIIFLGDSCSAIIIANDVLVRSKPSLDASSEIICKLKKWDDVHLIDCTKEKTKIDNLEYPWYKLQLENGQEGWIFGGFAKIYFYEHDKGPILMNFEKEGSEYTNQFETPEGFY